MYKLRSIFEVDFLNKLWIKYVWSINKPFFFFIFYTSFILLFRKFTSSILLLDFKDLKYKWSIHKVYFPYSFFCKGMAPDWSKPAMHNQALSGDFQHVCGKKHKLILLGMRWCVMSVFLFLKFYNFFKGIMQIYIVFPKNLRQMPLFFIY